MSDLLHELQAEHALIDAVLGSLRTYVSRRVRDGLSPDDAAGFLRFFRLYAGRFHHAREEDVLFRALVDGAGLPEDRGPIAIIVREHHELGAILDALAPLLTARALGPGERDELEALALRYSHGLWHHIDAENSVLFPEGGERLRRAHLGPLVSRAPDAEEDAARAEGVALVARYPPLFDADVIRGEGCVHCPSYGVTCDGLEREWWTEHEWDELDDRAKNSE